MGASLARRPSKTRARRHARLLLLLAPSLLATPAIMAALPGAEASHACGGYDYLRVLPTAAPHSLAPGESHVYRVDWTIRSEVMVITVNVNNPSLVVQGFVSGDDCREIYWGSAEFGRPAVVVNPDLDLYTALYVVVTNHCGYCGISNYQATNI